MLDALKSKKLVFAISALVLAAVVILWAPFGTKSQIPFELGEGSSKPNSLYPAGPNRFIISGYGGRNGACQIERADIDHDDRIFLRSPLIAFDDACGPVAVVGNHVWVTRNGRYGPRRPESLYKLALDAPAPMAQPISMIPSPYISALLVLGENTIWAAGHEIFVSTDAGKSWTQSNLPGFNSVLGMGFATVGERLLLYADILYEFQNGTWRRLDSDGCTVSIVRDGWIGGHCNGSPVIGQLEGNKVAWQKDLHFEGDDVRLISARGQAMRVVSSPQTDTHGVREVERGAHVHDSVDGGKSWTTSRLRGAGAMATSPLTMLEDGSLIVLDKRTGNLFVPPVQ